MKKFLLIAAAGLMGLAASAQRDMEDQWVDNLIVNGSFEDPGYVQSVISDFTWEFYDHTAADGEDPWMALSELPGWCNIGNSTWMGWSYVAGEEGDDDLRLESDYNYVRMQSYKDNGWTDHFTTIAQVVKGVEVGTTYRLDFVAFLSLPQTGSWDPWGTPGMGVRVSELDYATDGTAQAGKEIANFFTNESAYYWADYDLDFAPTSADLYIDFYLSVPWGEGNEHDNMYAMVDDVRLYDKAKAEDTKAGIAGIVADENAPVEIYSINGMRVANTSNLKGVYVVKQGATTKKVVY